MSIELCSVCDTLFDTDVEVEAQFVPEFICEQCVYENQQPDDGDPAQVTPERSRRAVAVIRPPKYNELMTFSRSLGRRS